MDVQCLVTQSCLTPCDPMKCSPPGSSVHGISQARILKWVAISFSRRSSWPRDWTCVFSSPALQANSLPLSHRGSLGKKQHLILFALRGPALGKLPEVGFETPRAQVSPDSKTMCCPFSLCPDQPTFLSPIRWSPESKIPHLWVLFLLN